MSTKFFIAISILVALAFLALSCSQDSSSVNKEEELNQKLEQSEDKFYALTHFLNENIDEGIVFVSMDGKIKEANKKYLDMIGYTLDEAKSLIYQQITPGMWYVLENDLRENQVMKKDFCEVYEKEYIRKNGSTFRIQAQAWLVTDEKGEPWRLMGVVRSVSK